MSTDRETISCKEITINDDCGFFDVVQSFSKSRWFFRGHSEANWKLETTFERNFRPRTPKDAQILEWSTVQTFKKDAIRYFDYGRSIEWLATMQHYGAPTRLLDFTESLMVALYFAMENAVKGQDACIWGLRQDQIWNSQEYFKHERFNEDDDIGGRVAREMFVKHNVYARNKQSLDFADDLIYNESPITSAQDLSTSSPRGVIPIYPLISNERLSAQSGLFLMLRDFSASFQENLQGTMTASQHELREMQLRHDAERYGFDGRVVVKLVLPWDFVRETPQLLKSSNITPKTLFPGMDGIGRSTIFFPYG